MRGFLQASWSNDVFQMDIKLLNSSHFLSFKFMPTFSSWINTDHMFSMCLESVLEKTTTSYRYTRAHCHLTKDNVKSVVRWNILGAFPMLKSILTNWKSPRRGMKDFLLWSASSTIACHQPLFSSRFKGAITSFLRSLQALIRSYECKYQIATAFNFLYLTEMWSDFSFLSANTIGSAYSVGSGSTAFSVSVRLTSILCMTCVAFCTESRSEIFVTRPRSYLRSQRPLSATIRAISQRCANMLSLTRSHLFLGNTTHLACAGHNIPSFCRTFCL